MAKFDMGKSGKKGFSRIFAAFINALQGIASAFKTESAFKQEVAAFIVMFPIAILVDVNPVSKALLVGTLFLVLVVELLNTAIEALSDKISPEYDDFIRKAKDCGSGAVFLSIVATTIIWAIILVDRYCS